MAQDLALLEAPTATQRLFPSSFGTTLPTRYDMHSFAGRFMYAWHFSTDPSTLLTPSSTLLAARDTMEAYDRPELRHTVAHLSDEELWQAQKMASSSVHPDTGELIPALFRRNSYIPVNVVMYAGMLFSPQTIPVICLWQTGNQLFNCGLNFHNRNASLPMSSQERLRNLAIAVGASTGVSIAAKLLLTAKTAVSPGGYLGALRHAAVPLLAVVVASNVNMITVRQNELREGINVSDLDGHVIGVSKHAAQDAILKTTLSRSLLAIPALAVFPMAKVWLDRRPFLAGRPVLRAAASFGALLGCVAASLPLSLAPFTSQVGLPAARLEPELRELAVDASGEPLSTVYYNRGV